MMDLFDLLSMCTVISLSIAMASLTSWIRFFVHKPHKNAVVGYKVCRRWIEVFCIALSVSITSFTIVLVLTDWQLILAGFTLLDSTYYITLFCLSYVIVLFYKILLPVLLPLYAIYCVFFLILLSVSYSAVPQEQEITIPFGGTAIVQGVTISYKNLLPLPRHWVSEAEIVIDADEVDFKEITVFSRALTKFNIDSFMYKVINIASELIIYDPKSVQLFFISEADGLHEVESKKVLFFEESSQISFEVFN